MKTIITFCFLIFGFSAYAQISRTVMSDTNGAVQWPTNFFSVNRILAFDTNGTIVYTNTNTLTFSNVLGFGTNSVAATRTNLGIGGGLTTNISVTGTNNTNILVFSNGILKEVQ